MAGYFQGILIWAGIPGGVSTDFGSMVGDGAIFFSLRSFIGVGKCGKCCFSNCNFFYGRSIYL